MTAAVVSAIAATEVPGQTIESADQLDSRADQLDSRADQAVYLAVDYAAAASVVAEVKAAVVAAVANFGPAVAGKEAAVGQWSLGGS